MGCRRMLPAHMPMARCHVFYSDAKDAKRMQKFNTSSVQEQDLFQGAARPGKCSADPWFYSWPCFVLRYLEMFYTRELIRLGGKKKLLEYCHLFCLCKVGGRDTRTRGQH